MGGGSWRFLPYFACFVLSRGYEHKTPSCLRELAGDDPGSAEGNGKLLLTGTGPDCFRPEWFFPSLVTADRRGSPPSAAGRARTPSPCWAGGNGAWRWAGLVSPVRGGKRRHGRAPVRFDGRESTTCHGHLSCCELSTESSIERQNIQFNYDHCSAIQVDLASPT